MLEDALYQLEAVVKDVTGNVTDDFNVVWSSSDGGVAAVDNSGLVSSQGIGQATIRATAEGVTGESAVSVVVAEPPSFVVVTSRPFDSQEEAGWWDASDADFEILADPTAPQSPMNVGFSRFRAGMTGGATNGTITGINFSDRRLRTVYLSMWIKFSSNWQGHSSGVNKIIFIGADGNPGRPAYLNAHGMESGTLEPRVNLQGTPAGGRNLTPNRTSRELSRGEWHRWELVLTMNTEGNADGEARWWIDGVSSGEYDDLSLVGADAQHWWDEVQWRPVWGGTGDQVQAEQSQSIDHFYISGQ